MFLDNELQDLVDVARAAGCSVDWVQDHIDHINKKFYVSYDAGMQRFLDRKVEAFKTVTKRASRRKILKDLRYYGYTIAYKRSTLRDILTFSKAHPYIKDISSNHKNEKIWEERRERKNERARNIAWQRQKNAHSACMQRLKALCDRKCGSSPEVEKQDAWRRKCPIHTPDGIYALPKIGLCHATFYEPQIGEDGCYELEALANSDGLRYPRNTLHFAVGHHVVSHLAGGWDEAPYVVITGLKDLIKKHDLPFGLSLVDTFFEVGLNENLHLPKDTHIVRPAIGPLPPNKDFVTYGNTTFYRTSGFSKESHDKWMEVHYPYEKKHNIPVSESKQSMDLKTTLVDRILYEKGFLGLDSSNKAQAENIARLAQKLAVHGSSGQELHASLALTGCYSPLDPEIVSIDNVTRTLERLIQLKKGIDIELMLPPLAFKSKLKTRESLDNEPSKGQPGDSLKKMSLGEVSKEVERGNGFLLKTFKKMQNVQAFIEGSTPEDKKIDAENAEEWKREKNWVGYGMAKQYSHRRKKVIQKASPRQQQVFHAWLERSQQRIDLIRQHLDLDKDK